MFGIDRRLLVTAGLLAGVLLITKVTASLAPVVFEPLQNQLVDRLFRLRSTLPSFAPPYDEAIVHVSIDDRELELRRQYYMERADFARLVRNLGRLGVAAQLHDSIFAAPQSEQGDRELREATFAAGHVYYGMALGLSAAGLRESAERSAEVAEVLDRQRFSARVDGSVSDLPAVVDPFITFPALALEARGLGFLDIVPDRDGVYRRVHLLVRDGDGFLPSMSLLVLADYLGVAPSTFELRPGQSLTLPGARRPGDDTARDLEIPIDRQGRVVVNFLGPWGRMTAYPFSVVYEASDDRFMLQDLREELRGKIAVVASSTTGASDVGAVPTEPLYPLSGVLANTMNTILTGRFLHEWGPWRMLFAVEIPLLLLLLLVATRLPPIRFVWTSVALAVLHFGAWAIAFLWFGRILNLPEPLIFLTGATIAAAGYRYHVEAEARARTDRELAVARDIQLRTFPKKMPEIAGYDVAGSSVPADETGGDSFDVVPLDDHRLLLLLADATGHGIGPALCATQVRAMLRIAARMDCDLDSMVNHMNDQLSDDLASNRFVTAFVGIARSDTHEVAYHAAGQAPIMHFHAAEDRFAWLGSSSTALGMMAGLPMSAADPLTLAPGDILGLMSDGVYECEDPASEQFG